jgi:alkylhydroperoxidase/carboxymuconolactone decarboxylase family protein YurZ
MYSPHETAQIQVWRQKCNDNTITKEELKEALALLARGRVAGAAASAESKSRKSSAAAKKAPVDSDKLLGELGDL